MTRIDGRTPEQARPITIETNFVRTAAGEWYQNVAKWYLFLA